MPNKDYNSDSSQSQGAEQPQSFSDQRAAKKEHEKESAKEGTQKAGKTIGAAAGAYLGGSAGAKVGAAIGDAVGKSKIGQKIGENVAKNPAARKAMSKLNDSGSIDALNKATDVATSGGGAPGGGTPGGPGGSPGGAAGTPGSGGESVLDKKGPSKPNFLGDDQDNQDTSGGGGSGLFTGSASVKVASTVGIFIAGIIGLLILGFVVVAQGSGSIAGYDDAFGVSSATGGATGGVDYEASSPEAQEFFDRVASVKNTLQAQGKSFDPVYISGVYVVLNQNGANLSYDDMTTGVITEIADAMFSGSSFSEDVFKQNLIDDIFPRYAPGKSKDTYEGMAEDVFQYYDDYFSLIGATASNCASLGSCVYEIKGFYIQGKGNVTKNLTITDLQVRLMQSGTGNGHNYGGTWGQPLEGEELVPFEKYILGVAYQEIGPDAPDEAIKAQFVAARSYILARPFDMGGWRKVEQEADGKWVIQVAASTQDQVYCDPDKGCSGTDGQWGQVHSGVDHGPGFVRQPLPADHKMRTLANETMGEVLVNDQGYIIYAGYLSTEQNMFIDLANQGLNYKQILLQVYNSGSRNYGAADIEKMSCNTGSGSGCNSTGSTGPYAGWKQADPAWGSITIGSSGSTIASVGCLVTSVSMLIAKSGVPVNVDGDFNPGTFVQKLNQVGGFQGANFVWGSVTQVAPSFHFVGKSNVSGMSQEQKLSVLQGLLNKGYYVVAEVKGNTGQHWVAVDGINGSNVLMMDPASQSTSMWSQYDWRNTSEFASFSVY